MVAITIPTMATIIPTALQNIHAVKAPIILISKIELAVAKYLRTPIA